jgi:DNA-binding IscR family transcriptional regulator
MLAKPPSDITLYELIESIDGDQIFITCMLGLNGCGHENPCPLHNAWSETRTKLKQLALHTTLAELASNTDFLNRQIAAAFMIGPTEMEAVGVTVPTGVGTLSKS